MSQTSNRAPSPPPKPQSNPQGERLQKLLAAAGFGSRREIERWIEAGRLRIGDRIAKLGDRASSEDKLFLDEKPLAFRTGKSQTRVLVYNKPIGEMVTRSDPGGRPTVFDRLPALEGERWINVGRLDLNSSGLLLFTNDGELANRLMHPRGEIEREYEVRVQGGLSAQALKSLLEGVNLEDGPARFLRLEPLGGRESSGSNRWYRAVLSRSAPDDRSRRLQGQPPGPNPFR
jgi:23S rRNA pseudouridine2605 synthase